MQGETDFLIELILIWPYILVRQSPVWAVDVDSNSDVGTTVDDGPGDRWVVEVVSINTQHCNIRQKTPGIIFILI